MIEREEATIQNFEKLFADIENLRVAVIGDVILDTYWWGAVERISPEAPVPVVSLQKKEHRIGGAGNVALNTISLGAETTLFSIVGEDEDAELLVSMLQEEHIDTKYIMRSSKRITTNKIRVLGHNHQMMRIDAEVTNDISKEEEEELLSSFESFVKRYEPAVIIFEDYNKGVLTESLIASIMNICKEHKIITAADPKHKNFFAYKGATIFKPDLKEALEHSSALMSNDAIEEHLQQLHIQLHEQLQHKISLITLPSFKLFFQKGSYAKTIASHTQNIADVSGCEDTIIAVAALVYTAEKNMMLAASLASLAAGVVCTHVGTVAINKQQLLAECRKSLN